MVICAFCDSEPSEQVYRLWICEHCKHTLNEYVWRRFGDVLLQTLDDFIEMDCCREIEGCYFCGRDTAKKSRADPHRKNMYSLCQECENKFLEVQIIRSALGKIEDDHTCIFCVTSKPIPICENHIQEIITDSAIINSLGHDYLPLPSTLKVRLRFEKAENGEIELHNLVISEET